MKTLRNVNLAFETCQKREVGCSVMVGRRIVGKSIGLLEWTCGVTGRVFSTKRADYDGIGIKKSKGVSQLPWIVLIKTLTMKNLPILFALQRCDFF